MVTNCASCSVSTSGMHEPDCPMLQTAGNPLPVRVSTTDWLWERDAWSQRAERAEAQIWPIRVFLSGLVANSSPGGQAYASHDTAAALLAAIHEPACPRFAAIHEYTEACRCQPTRTP